MDDSGFDEDCKITYSNLVLDGNRSNLFFLTTLGFALNTFVDADIVERLSDDCVLEDYMFFEKGILSFFILKLAHKTSISKKH